MGSLNQHKATEQQQPSTTDQSNKDIVPRFVFIWRSRGLTAGAKTIDEMIDALDGATDALRLLKEAGVVLDTSAETSDDACLITTDAAVAQRFGFMPERSAGNPA